MGCGDHWIRMAQTNLYLTDVTIYNVSSYDESNFIFVDYSSVVNITNVQYTLATTPFLHSSMSNVYANMLRISNWNTDYEWLYIFKSPSTSIANSEISNWSSKRHPSNFLLLSWSVSMISNTTISNTDLYAIDIRFSNITTLEGLIVSKTYGIYAKNSIIHQIVNSNFTNNGKGVSINSPNSIKGGSIYFENTNFTINLSTFSNNTSKSGAGIYISWQLNSAWITSITNSTFSK